MWSVEKVSVCFYNLRNKLTGKLCYQHFFSNKFKNSCDLIGLIQGLSISEVSCRVFHFQCGKWNYFITNSDRVTKYFLGKLRLHSDLIQTYVRSLGIAEHDRREKILGNTSWTFLLLIIITSPLWERNASQHLCSYFIPNYD